MKGRCGVCSEAAVGSFRVKGTGTTFGKMRTVLEGERMKGLNPGEQILVRSVIKKSFCSVLLVAVKHTVIAFVEEIGVLLAACSPHSWKHQHFPARSDPAHPKNHPGGRISRW